MEASTLLHLEDLSSFYPIIASKTGVVALLSYSNCFTTPTLVDNYRTPVDINGQSYCRLSFQLWHCESHRGDKEQTYHHCKVPFAITTVSSLSRWHDSHLIREGVHAETDSDKAKFLADQFCKNFNTIDPPLLATWSIPTEGCSAELLITEKEVYDYLVALDPSKATGPDSISSIMLKNTAAAIAPIITSLFNMSLRTCKFPDSWKVSYISPIPKSGDLSNPANYRPVSLLPIISKVFERHIHHLISDSIHISDNQWGFLPGRSTTGAVLSALANWESNLDHRLEIMTVFFDLSKAFDTVPHSRLLAKLQDLNIPRHIISLISSYLCNRSQYVCVNGSISHKTHVLSGVPQGSVLGPLLFLLYTDGLAQSGLSDGSLVLYADDICLYRPLRSSQDVIFFQHDIDKLADKINDLGLKLNINKCKFMLLSRKKHPSTITTVISGNQLEQVSSYRYLGFLVTEDLKWSDHIQLICSKARKQLGYIYRQFYKSNANSATLRSLYIALVRPILEYGACIWDPYLQKDINAIESVQKFAVKLCTKIWSLPYSEGLTLLGLEPLAHRRKILKLCFFHKIMHGHAVSPAPLSLLNHNYSTRSHNLCLRTSHARNNSYLFSFFNATIKLWNDLPNDLVNCNNVFSFKKYLPYYL